MRAYKTGIWLAISFFTGIIVGVGGLALMNRVQPAPLIIQPAAPTHPPEPTVTPGPMRVFVNGQVTVPDVYELPTDSIVKTAIEAAGGFTTEANTAVVNLAQPLQDGMQVYVPSLEEGDSEPAVIVNTSAIDLGNTADDTAVNQATSTLINLNTASLEELDALPGIGPSTAQKIIEHRDENGPFTSIEGVMDVSGIGEAKFDQMKDLITIEGD